MAAERGDILSAFLRRLLFHEAHIIDALQHIGAIGARTDALGKRLRNGLSCQHTINTHSCFFFSRPVAVHYDWTSHVQAL